MFRPFGPTKRAMRRVHRLWFLAALAFCACGGAHKTVQAPAMPSQDTTLGVGDVFDVRVYGENDLSGTYMVAQDGTIDFPLIGRLHVEGLEPTAVADLLTSKLENGKILKDPQVSILVKEYKSKQVSIVGAVAKPGSYSMQPGMTVIQAISQAGGFTALANRNSTTVTRRVGDKLVRYEVPAGNIQEGTARDFRLQNGDIVYVPERVF